MQDVNDVPLVQIRFHLILQNVLQVLSLPIGSAAADTVYMAINLHYGLLTDQASQTVLTAAGAGSIVSVIGGIRRVAGTIGSLCLPIDCMTVSIDGTAVSVCLRLNGGIITVCFT